MKSEIDDVSTLHAQLAEKQQLVAALTSQLEKSAVQLDRLRRSGAERSGGGDFHLPAAIPNELTGKLNGVLDEWQEIQPAVRIDRIESGIEEILELVKGLQGTVSLERAAPSAPSRPLTNEEFWAAEKARLLGETVSPAPSDREGSVRVDRTRDASTKEFIESRKAVDFEEIDESIYAEIGAAPESPDPVSTIHDTDELLAAVKSRDGYIQYLISRLRIAESRKLKPVKWELLESAPDNFRGRLEALETVLKDHLRQAEVSHSLERALLGRERAKLAQIKLNLETQIKKLAMLGTTSPAAEPVPGPDAKVDPESRWKRIFTR